MRLKFSKSWLAILCLLLLVGCGTKGNQASNPLSGTQNGSSRLPNLARDISVGQEDISVTAIGLIGIPYRWGGNNPDGGFDCSGLIHYVFASTRGKKIPRTTAEMPKVSSLVEDAPLAPGDLVFFNTLGSPYSHVGIYVGKGRFVHAPNAGGTVRLEQLQTPYWSTRFTEARRISTASL
jgi:cell wall-associated NlpC family hydrolase